MSVEAAERCLLEFLQSKGTLGFCRYNVQINNRLLRETVEVPCLEILKRQLDAAQSKLL